MDLKNLMSGFVGALIGAMITIAAQVTLAYLAFQQWKQDKRLEFAQAKLSIFADVRISVLAGIDAARALSGDSDQLPLFDAWYVNNLKLVGHVEGFRDLDRLAKLLGELNDLAFGIVFDKKKLDLEDFKAKLLAVLKQQDQESIRVVSERDSALEWTPLREIQSLFSCWTAQHKTTDFKK